ncbi:MAG: hypothetical protein ABGW77_00910 [Campylobacterales bacterium]
MEKIATLLVTLLLSLSLLSGFQEGDRLLKELQQLNGKLLLHKEKGGLLFATDLYRFQIPLDQNSSITIKLNLKRARLPISRGNFTGEVEKLVWDQKLYSHPFHFSGETSNFRRFEFKLSPVQLGPLFLPAGRGIITITPAGLRGTIQFPTLSYSTREGEVVGEYLRIEFNWSRKESRRLITIGKIAGKLRDGVLIEGEGLNLERVTGSGEMVWKGFLKSLKLEDRGGGRIEIGKVEGEVNSSEGVPVDGIAGFLKVGRVTANKTPMGFLKVEFQLSSPRPASTLQQLLNGPLPPDLSLNLVVEGSDRLLEALRPLLSNPVIGFLFENLDRDPNRERVSISMKGGEVLVNGKRNLP